MSNTGRTTEEQFLGRVAKALGRSTGPRAAGPGDRALPDAPAVDDALLRLTGPDEDLPAVFEKGAKFVGMEVRRTTRDRLAADLIAFAREIKAKTAVAALDQLPQGGELKEALTQAGVTLLSWERDPLMVSAFEADMGVTEVEAALAETGTLICPSGDRRARGLSLAPPVHVAILRRRDLLPDMLDYFAARSSLGPADLPASQALITGPSKTADIEGVLVTGVHGPARVVILLVTDD